MSNKTTTSVGVSFTGLLTVLFVGLKLTGYITWSWFWVISPILFWPAVLIAAFFIWLLIAIPATLIQRSKLRFKLNRLKKESKA